MLLLVHWSYVDITWLRYFKFLYFCSFHNFLYFCSSSSLFRSILLLNPILTLQAESSRNMDSKSPGWQLCCSLKMIVYWSSILYLQNSAVILAVHLYHNMWYVTVTVQPELWEPAVQWMTRASSQVMMLTTGLHLVMRWKMSGSIIYCPSVRW